MEDTMEDDFESVETLEAELIEAGYDEQEVEELLYDPVPKKGRRKKTKSTTRSRRDDPAPGKNTTKAKKKGRKKPKGTLAKVKKFALPGTAGLTFYAGYLKRADELFTAGSIPKKSVFSAIEYDVKNFDLDAGIERLKNGAGSIITPLVGGAFIKETKILGKHSGLAADILFGLGTGKAAKTLLDPPISDTKKSSIRKVQSGNSPAETHQISAPAGIKNPYM